MALSMEWNGDDIFDQLRDAEMDGLEAAAEHLLQVSSFQAPLEEGDLARSGEVSSDPDQHTVAVSYDRPYAVRQHEELTWRHDAGKKAKYLEDPMHTEQETMLALIAGPLRDELDD